MENNTFNINRRIRIVLTKEGAKALNTNNSKEIEEFLSIYPHVDCNFLRTDYVEGEIVEDSLWYIFSCLGEYFKGNTNAPFVNNEITFID